MIIGAVSSERVLVLLRRVVDELGVPERDVSRAVKKQTLALGRRERVYRGDTMPIAIAGRP